MRDFNTVCSELVKHLRLSCQRQDGEIWWYEGTLELMTELLSFAESKPETNADKLSSMSDEELADYFSELSCWPNAGKEDCRGVANCMVCWLDWLRREAET